MNLKTTQYIRELDAQFALVKRITDEEELSMLTQYLCVRTSGLLEIFIQQCISDFAQGRVPQVVNHFLSSKLKDVTNLKTKKLESLLDSFSSEWKEAFCDYIKEHEQIKNSVDSLLTNRHNIAHGKRTNVSFRDLQQYYQDTKSIISKMSDIIH